MVNVKSQGFGAFSIMKKFLLLIVSYDTFGGGTGVTGVAGVTGVTGVTATTVTIAMRPLNQRQQTTHNDHHYSYHRRQQKRRNNNNNNNSYHHPYVYDNLFDDVDNISDIGDNNNNNISNNNTNNKRNQTTSNRNFKHWITDIRIPFYIIIFILAVVGNSLVILTLVQNKRMRTVTNVFLLNLSISDLLLAVFCMPFTLIPTIMQDFIFGKTVCVLIRYLQEIGCVLERDFELCPIKDSPDALHFMKKPLQQLYQELNRLNS
eukprot:XP_014780988.1 PREDICTED: putative mediator of RNA polymerase II transcription subunit 24 [Octopus bimaculoides]